MTKKSKTIFVCLVAVAIALLFVPFSNNQFDGYEGDYGTKITGFQYISDNIGTYIFQIIILLFFIGIVLACRELTCWYFKINQHLDNQKKIIAHMERQEKER